MHKLTLLASALLYLTSLILFANPELARIEPRGAKLGSEVDLHLYGKHLDSPQELLFHQPGIELLKLETKDPNHLVARIRIAPDAALGEHPMRLRCSHGISYLRTLWVGQFPTTAETEPNNSFDTPQKLELNTTVQGISKSEDEDYYSVTLKKGQSLSVEVEAMRLGRTFFDAYLAILNPKRFELAACDDVPLLYTDAFATIVAPEDGEYRILIREAAYQGNDAAQYRLHIGSFPRPVAVFPTGAHPGETLNFRFIGDPAGEITREITIPANASGRFPVYAERNSLRSPSPNWIHVSSLASGNEIEPNNNQKQATPTPSFPCAVHGILADEGDVDWFRFSANKGQNLDFRVIARKLRSPLDSVISIRDSKNKYLAGNDDQPGPDSFLKWTCPGDGDYTISIRDKLARMGPDFTYRLELDLRKPSIVATLPVAERNQSQLRKMISIPRGNRYATVVNISRSNLGCAALFQADELPAGVTMHVPAILRSLNNFPVVFEASTDAPIKGDYYRFNIRATGDKAPDISGPLHEEIHHIEINNQGPYHSTFSDKIAVAVTEEAPFTLTLESPPVPLVQRGVAKLKVRVQRKSDYKEAITLRFLWKPPGIGAPASIKLPGDKSEIGYEINANADAPPGDWQIAIVAHANTKSGPIVISTALVPLKVVEPFVTATIDLSATEQGQPTSVICHLEQLTDFSGKAQAELIGLPHGTKTTPLEFTNKDDQLTFLIQVAKDATIGKHSGLFLRLKIPQNGSTILHQSGQGGTLRIDKPRPKQAAAKPTKDKPAKDKPKHPTTKPLSRLEQLRQQADDQ